MQQGRIAVVGYGVVGKRVADAVAQQPDMTLAGVVDVVPSDLVRMALERGFSIYLASEAAREGFDAAGIPVAGTMADLLPAIDIVVDCSPPGITGRNVETYRAMGVKFIVEGGEKHSLTGLSFSSFANYGDALNASAVRVVSCNTTSQCRLLSTLDRAFGVKEAFIAITRRGADPVNLKSGPINAVVATLPGFSHHAPDVQTIMPAVNIRSMAVVASTTLMHVHTMRIELDDATDAASVRAALAATPRVRLVSGARGIDSTAHLIEWARDAGRPRNDHWEIAVWEDSIVLDGNVLYMLMAVHMESVIVPETIDCLRAMLGHVTSASEAVRTTDAAMGFVREDVAYAQLDSPLRHPSA